MNPIEQILLEMGLDLSPLRAAADTIQAVLEDLNHLAEESLKKSAAAAQSQTSQYSEIKETVSSLIEKGRELLSQSGKIASARDKETEALKRQLEVTREIHGEGENFLQKLISESGGIFGFAASVMGIGAGANILSEKIDSFLDSFRRGREEASQLTLAMDLFGKATKTAGVDGQHYMAELQEATDGLVSKLDLASYASRALSSGIKSLTPEKIVELTGATVKLAEANGHYGKEAIEALQRVFTYGAARGITQLAAITGLTREAISVMDQIPRGLSEAERTSLSFEHTLALLITRAAEIGDVPETFEGAIRRIQIVLKDLLLSFGSGINESAGMQLVFGFLKEGAKSLEGMEGGAEALGKTLGNIVALLSVAAKSVLDTVKAFAELGVHGVSLLGKLLGLSDETDKMKKNTDAVKGSLADMQPELASVVDIFIDLNAAIQTMAVHLGGMIDDLKEWVGSQTFRHLVELFTMFQGAAMGLSAGTALAPVFGPLAPLVGLSVGAAGGFVAGHEGMNLLDEVRSELSGKPEYRGTGADVVPYGADIVGVKTGPRMRDQAKAYPGASAQDVLNYASGRRTAVPAASRQALEADALEKIKQDREKGHAYVHGALASPSGKGTLPPPADTGASLQQQREIDKARLAELNEKDKARTAYAKQELAQQLDDIQEHQSDVSDLYQRGLMTFYEYQAAMRKINQDRLDAQNEAARLEHDTSVNLLRNQYDETQKDAKLNGELQEVTDAKLGAIRTKRIEADSTYTAALVKNSHTYHQADVQLSKQGTDEHIKQLTETANAEKAVAEERVKIQTKLNEEAYKIGNKTPEEYLRSRQQLIDEQMSTEQAHAGRMYEIGKKTPTAATAYFDAYMAAQQKAADAREELSQQTPDIILGGTDKQAKDRREILTFLGEYSAALQDIATQEQKLTAVANDPASSPDTQAKAIQTRMGLLKEESTLYEQHIKRLTVLGSIKEAQATAEAERQRLQIALAAETNPAVRAALLEQYMDVATGNGPGSLPTLANQQRLATTQGLSVTGAGDLAKLFAAVSGGRTVRNLAEVMGSAEKFYSASSGYGEQIGAPIDRTGNDRQEVITQWTNKLAASTQALTQFASSVLTAKNALSGGVGGLTAGLGLGNTIGRAKSTAGQAKARSSNPSKAAMGSKLSSPAMGKATMGITAGLGLFSGIKSGKQQKQITNTINAMQAATRNIMQQFALNNNNLSETIGQLQAQLQQARSLQSSSKKGSSSYTQEVNTLIQQIQQLQVQQAQLMRQMWANLSILQQMPPASQQYLQTLEQIVQQYQQYEGAASNAQELTAANQWLILSLQQYQQANMQQMLQDNTQAIQDAIQLSDLQFQAQQMQLQYNQQINSLMSAGVVTRQWTRAQTAGQQIELLNVQYQRQMDQINEQIAAAQYRVNAESQIFTIAATRIGLETQLLALQNAQTDLDMQRIAALQGLIAQISSGNFSTGSIGSLLNSMQTVTNTAVGVAGGTSILSVISGLLAGGASLSPQDAYSLLQVLAAGAYSYEGGLGSAGFNGQNLGS